MTEPHNHIKKAATQSHDRCEEFDFTVEQVTRLLCEGGYPFMEVCAEFDCEYGGYSFFDIVITLDKKYCRNYAYISDLLAFIDKSSAKFATMEADVILSIKARCCDNMFEINASDSNELEINGESVYNVISAKRGKNLTLAEKLNIFEAIHLRYGYYRKKFNTANYSKSKYTSAVFRDIAKKYCVSVGYLRREIWTQEIRDAYLKEHVKKR